MRSAASPRSRTVPESSPSRTAPRNSCESAAWWNAPRFTRLLRCSCSDLAAPVLEEIVERPFERDVRRPAELLANSRRIALDERHVAGPEPRRVHAELHGDARLRDEALDDRADGDRSARADV